MSDATSRVGELLREWRSIRSMSQLALALEANVSARHVSFIETGRSRPSRTMLLQLADALDVPLRERNALLSAAGFAPAFQESLLETPALEAVNAALESILRQQEPNPAVVMDRQWNILRSNEGAVRLFSRLIDLAAVRQPANVLRLMFDPAGLRPFVSNWEEVSRWLLVRAGRELVCGMADPKLRSVIEEARAFPGVPERPLIPGVGESIAPVVPICFEKGSFLARYFSTVTTLGTAQDVTLQEIRIECFFPIHDHGGFVKG